MQHIGKSLYSSQTTNWALIHSGRAAISSIVSYESERRMNRRTCLPIAITILAVSAAPALAQSRVGGPTKPINHVGGAATNPNPVVPPSKGVTASTVPSNPTSAKNPASPSTSTKKK
jgi:hypothetical protein